MTHLEVMWVGQFNARSAGWIRTKKNGITYTKTWTYAKYNPGTGRFSYGWAKRWTQR